MDKKVLFALSSMGSGGAERVVSILTKQFIENGYDVGLLLTYFDAKDLYYDIDPRVNVHFIKDYSANKSSFSKILAIRKIIKNNSYTCVISFLTNVNILMILSTLFLSVKLIVSERSSVYFLNKFSLLSILRRFLYLLADVIVVQTSQNKKELSKNLLCVKLDKIKIIPNPYNSIIDKLEKSSYELRKRIIAVGRYSQEKRFEDLIDAFSLVFDNSWRLDIFGHGNLKEHLISYSKTKHHNIHINDNSNDIYNEMINSDIFVLTSEFEGYPNVLVESLALGVPSISYDCPDGPRELSDNGKNLLLVENGNINELKKALGKLSSDIFLRESLSRNSIKYTRESLNSRKIFSIWKSII